MGSGRLTRRAGLCRILKQRQTHNVRETGPNFSEIKTHVPCSGAIRERGVVPEQDVQKTRYAGLCMNLKQKDKHVSLKFLRALGSQSGECVWQHTLVG